MPDDQHDVDPRRLVIRRQQHMARLAEMERAMRVGSTPDPSSMRGAAPVTIRAPLGEDGRMVRAAAYRLAPGHECEHLIDRMGRDGRLPPRLYANACAVWVLHDLTIGRSGGISEYGKLGLGRSGGCTCDGAACGRCGTPLDRINYLIRNGGKDFAALLMAVRQEGDYPAGSYRLAMVRRALDPLDHMQAFADGLMWPDEKDA